MGWLTMIVDKLAVPFETTVLGVSVVVERIDLNRRHQIIAVCRRGRERQSEDEGSGDWIEGAGRLSSLISLRAELARGDLAVRHRRWPWH